MKKNVAFSIGNVALIDKVNENYNVFDKLFDNIGTKAENIKNSAKLFCYNRLGDCVSINQLTKVYPEELFLKLGYKDMPSERTLYRELERIGDRMPFLQERYQDILAKNNLLSDKQFLDFSSSYFEGKKSVFGKLGYSRDHEPSKEQLTFGICTGINNIPAALTIQKGNVQDKTHMNFMLKLTKHILDKESILIFDCGGNTKKVKDKIRKRSYNYLTLMPKKKKSYQKYIHIFRNTGKTKIVINETTYSAIKIAEKEEIKYLYYSEGLHSEQIRKRTKKFERELNKNDAKLKKIKSKKPLATYISKEGHILAKGIIQKSICKINNPFISGLEGFFILESSVNDCPEKMLKLYKEKDKAEKLIRNMKEGTEIRPIRHWSTSAIIGYLFIIFLTNCLFYLTQFSAKINVAKNLKLLKKYLNKFSVSTNQRK